MRKLRHVILRILLKIKHQEEPVWFHSSCIYSFYYTAFTEEDLYRQLHLNTSNELGTVWITYVNCPHFTDEGLSPAKVKSFKVIVLNLWPEFELNVSEFKAGIYFTMLTSKLNGQEFTTGFQKRLPTSYIQPAASFCK